MQQGTPTAQYLNTRVDGDFDVQWKWLFFAYCRRAKVILRRLLRQEAQTSLVQVLKSKSISYSHLKFEVNTILTAQRELRVLLSSSLPCCGQNAGYRTQDCSDRNHVALFKRTPRDTGFKSELVSLVVKAM